MHSGRRMLCLGLFCAAVVAALCTVGFWRRAEQSAVTIAPSAAGNAAALPPEPGDGPEPLPETPTPPTHAPTVKAEVGPRAVGPPPLRFSSSTSSFSLHKIGPGNGPTLLVVGGIQGDEPGGFSAAALLASHYEITHGQVWVVPDLNFAGILQRSRGPNGDMNRKFAALSPSDPEYGLIVRLKGVLLDPQVDLILNLHDGSGWYRPEYRDELHNPKRWGQCVIIDQARMADARFGDLNAMARTACLDVNTSLLDEEHRYHIRNTRTAAGDKEMAKALTWFAVRNGKPAFGVEAGKELGTEYRAFYHLRVIESFLEQMCIGFERRFELSPRGVSAALNSDLFLAAWDKKIILPLDDVRPSISRVPFKKAGAPDSVATRPLLALVQEKDGWRVAYGNRTLTRLRPELVDFDDSVSTVGLTVDGVPLSAGLGELIEIRDTFRVDPMPGYRVNAIGARREVNGTEAGIHLHKKDFEDCFSVDNKATTYRVEIYKGNAFAGMILVRFGEAGTAVAEPLTGVKGPESNLGY